MYDEGTARVLISKTNLYKRLYERVSKVIEALTVIKGSLSNNQLSFEFAEREMNTAIEAVPGAIKGSNSFDTRYLPIMQESLSVISKTVEKNNDYIEAVGKALEDADEKKEYYHEQYMAAYNELSYYRVTYSLELQASGLYDQSFI